MSAPRPHRRTLLLRSATLTGLAVGAASLGAPDPASAAMEAQLYAITVWDADCNGGTRNAWDDMGDAWYNDITWEGFWFWGHGSDAYSRDRRVVNGNIADSWFTDTAKAAFGNDVTYLDEGDAVMLCTHGSESNGRYAGTMRIDEPGSGNCKTWQGHMDLGDSDLEFLHLSSCQSLDDNQWAGEWHDSFKGLHQVNGFHGFMWISSSFTGDYSGFSNDAFHEPIADAWLDNLYRPNVSGSDDQCPVSYAVGANSADCWNRIGSEEYDDVLSDPTTVRYWGCIYISGCDPANEDVIGDDI